MTFTTTARRLNAGSALPALALAASIVAAPAFAQAQTDSSPAAPPAASGQTTPSTPTQLAAAAPEDTGAPAEEIVVTGTLFRSATTTASPVSVLTADSLAKSGITNVADAVRSISADSAGSIGVGFQGGFSAGGAAVSLRGVGVSSTVILVDGLRSTNFPLNDDGHNAYVDLNSIPITNIESVQVLKDGASSLYGADAIGGVVNIITRKHIQGIEGGAEGGVSSHKDGQKYKGHLAAGYGDYASQGFNVYVTGEYEYDGRVSNNSRGFPFNTLDLTSIGGIDNNRADDSLTTSTTDAIVTRVRQTDLNNPLAGTITNATTPALFQTLTSTANCANGTFSVASSTQIGTACKHNLQDEYRQILPLQERYGFSGRLSYRFSDSVEGYVTGSYMHDRVDIIAPPQGIRNTQPFGAPGSVSAANPGIVLPVYVCSAGINCATAADRRLNPNDPYAAAYANDPNNGAARIYYLFGDVKSGSSRINQVYRGTAGLNGHFGDSWDWRVEGVYARDNLRITDYGYPNIVGLLNAINTGSYNFVNPSLNSAAVRAAVLPDVVTPSHSTEATVDASISRTLFTLSGGDVKLAVGGQFRRELLTNNSRNPNLATYNLTTSQAYGKRSVKAGYFEVDAPILDNLDVNASGRYDDYSEGYHHFSPKFGVKFSPIKAISLRGTYSQGFRAPTFAEEGPRSQYAGFSNYVTPAAFKTAHPNNSAYSTTYSLGTGLNGNPNLTPEKSRSFTAGIIVQPKPWLTVTADYFDIKKSNLIVGAPLAGKARDAYYSVSGNSYASATAAAAAGCAAVAAVGAGYSCNLVDGADPFAPNALPRLLILNGPFVNANFEIISGFDVALNAAIPISADVKFNSRAEVTDTLKYNLHLADGTVQRYAGTLGPQELSSGNGTPRIRANWQNTLTYGKVALTATTYFVGHIKEVAADEGSLDLSCNAALYKATDGSNKFCYVHSFTYADLNATLTVSDQFQFYMIVGNFTKAHAPIAPAGYTSSPNYLTTWHTPGLVGRTFRAGANFKF